MAALGKRPNWASISLADVPPIEDDELHLWWLPLHLNAQQSEMARGLLSDIQRDKYVRRATDELKHTYLAGRYYLLNLIGAYAGCAPDEVMLSYTRLNKPFLSLHDKDIEFNFTDTSVNNRAFGLFAFTKDKAVGVDLEARSRRSDFAAIAARRFTPAEQDFIADPDGKAINPDRFLAIWTRKEAYGKAIGVGINFQMNRRDLVSEASELDFWDRQDHPWHLEQFEFGDELIAAVVYATHQRLSIKAWNALNHIP